MIVASVFFALWIGVAVVSLPFCVFVAYDAYRDVQVRRISGINHGRETLARLLVVTASLTGVVFLCWILLGLYQLGLYRYFPDSWMLYVTPVLSLLSEMALAFAMIYKQRTRRRVLAEDQASERVQKAAAADLASVERRDLTEATRELKVAVEEQTQAIITGPIVSQLAQTEATEELTVATDKLSIITESNTASIDISIKARQGDASDG